MYRETILHACAHPLSYDLQVEGGRELLLYDVIQATGEPEYYIPRLTELLLTIQEFHGKNQLFGLAVLFAKARNKSLRLALYRRFAEDMALRPSENDIVGGHTFIELDGISGYLFVADLFRRYTPNLEDYYEHGSILNDLEDQLGKEETRTQLEAVTADTPELWSYILQVYAHEEKQVAERKERLAAIKIARRNPFPYEVIYDRIYGVKSGVHPGPWMAYGRSMTNETALQLAADLLAETNRAPRIKLLRLFKRRPFPLDWTPLLSWAQSQDDELAWAACDVLAQVQHPAIGALARELLPVTEWPWHIATLLEKNYQPGDYLLLERLLREYEGEIDPFHCLILDLRRVCEANPLPETSGLLTLIYEISPCSMCRHAAVQSLVNLSPLPEWMAAECAYDSDADTRKLSSVKI